MSPQSVLRPVSCRHAHGNGKDWDPMGFPCEWEYNQPWDGNWNKTRVTENENVGVGKKIK